MQVNNRASRRKSVWTSISHLSNLHCFCFSLTVSAVHPHCKVVDGLQPRQLMLGLNRETVPNLMCTGPRYSHPLQCPLALERTSWETYSTLKCPASLWKAKRDLHAVLIWQLALEFSCALHHDDICLPTSQPSTDSALWRSFILSPKALRSCFSLFTPAFLQLYFTKPLFSTDR